MTAAEYGYFVNLLESLTSEMSLGFPNKFSTVDLVFKHKLNIKIPSYSDNKEEIVFKNIYKFLGMTISYKTKHTL